MNLSARQVADPSLPACVEAAIAGAGIAPDCLVLEITESTLVEDTEAVAECWPTR